GSRHLLTSVLLLRSHHKRSKSSAALALLRGKHRGSPELDASDDGSQPADTTPPDNLSATSSRRSAAMADPPSHPQLSRHSSKPSSSTPNLNRTPSTHHSPPRSSMDTKGATLEQSVRKFRIVEALRSGDTASISKAIRETAEGGTRTSIS